MRALSGHHLQQDLATALAPSLRAIAASIGPEGRHVIYATGNRVAAARTGSEIARHICSDHYAEQLLKETLVSAERQFGDGTARLAVMAGAVLATLRKAGGAEIPGAHLDTALAGLRTALDAAFAAETRSLVTAEELICGTGLPDRIAELVAEADLHAGPDGLIEVSEGGEPGVRAGDGFAFDAGVIGTAPLSEMSDVHLIVANEVLSDFRTLVPVIEGFATHGKALVIVARGIEGNARQLIERNRQAGRLKIAALSPADAGARAGEILEDLAAATGAQLVCTRAGTTIDALKPAMLGRAERFQFDGGLVRLSGAAGRPEAVALRVAVAAAEIEAKRYLPFDREHAERRRSRLLGRWAVVTIARGANAAAEIEAVRRVVAGLRNARAGGVIEGAGRGFDKIAARLSPDMAQGAAGRVALAMVDAALRAPGRCLQQNGAAGPQDMPPGRPVVDPARLSRDLLDLALSLGGRLGGIDGAILHH